jgi:hypothetical protein
MSVWVERMLAAYRPNSITQALDMPGQEIRYRGAVTVHTAQYAALLRPTS